VFIEIPRHKFGLGSLHNGAVQKHPVVNHIQKVFKKKKYCCGVFIDVKQAFGSKPVYSSSLTTFFPRLILVSVAHFLLVDPSTWMYEDLSLLQGLYLLESHKELCWALSYIQYLPRTFLHIEDLQATTAQDTAFLFSLSLGQRKGTSLLIL